MTFIHPTAIVDEGAKLEEGVHIGPYSIIASSVSLGKNCRIDSHVHIKGNTTVGSNNHFFHSCSVGQPPQDFNFKDGPHSTIAIGEGNVFREFSTVHGSTIEKGTVIGNHNYFMGGAHVAHDVHIKDHVLLTQGAIIGGHASIGSHVYISSVVAVHQHARVGAYSLVGGGGTGVAQDVLPYTLVRGLPACACGLNTIGLRRGGIVAEARKAIKRSYSILYGRDASIPKRIEAIKKEVLDECEKDTSAYEHIKYFVSFAEEKSKLGIITKEIRLS